MIYVDLTVFVSITKSNKIK